MPVGSLDYTPPGSSTFTTTPTVGLSGTSTHRALLDDAQRARLEVGTRVAVQPGVPNLGGLMGSIVDTGPFLDGDCAVLLDGWGHTIGFYCHELVICRTGLGQMLPSVPPPNG